MDTRELILDTAFRAFMKKGIDGISLNEIVKQTGLTKGAFYHHYRNKDELLEEFVLKYLYNSIDRHISKMELASGDSYFKIQVLVESIIEYHNNPTGDSSINPKDFHALMFSVMHKDINLKSSYRKSIDKIRNTLIATITEGQKNKIVSEINGADEIALLLISSVLGTIQLWLADDSIDFNMCIKNNINLIIEKMKI